LQPFSARFVLITYSLGLTGFDSKMNVYVSMPSLAMTLENLDREQQLAKITTLSLRNRSLVDYCFIPTQGVGTRHPAGGNA
jgi:hypothetical protein